MSTKGRGKGIEWLREHIGHDGDDCLIWPFSRGRDGYGQFGFNGKVLKAHRWMCEAVNGPPPAGYCAAHNCGRGIQGCVNPKHLEWKTLIQNSQDTILHGNSGKAKGRRRFKLTLPQVAEIKALKGIKGDTELAKIYGVSTANIRLIFKDRIWNGGSKRIMRAFSDAEIHRIRSLAQKIPAKDLADEYGVSRTVIYNIWSRRGWFTVPEAEVRT